VVLEALVLDERAVVALLLVVWDTPLVDPFDIVGVLQNYVRGNFK